MKIIEMMKIKKLVFNLFFLLVFVSCKSDKSSDVEMINSFVSQLKRNSSNIENFTSEVFPNKPKEIQAVNVQILRKILNNSNKIEIVPYLLYESPNKLVVNVDVDLVYLLLLEDEEIYIKLNKNKSNIDSIIPMKKGKMIIGWL